ncbi:MAG TPA: hypothetical protein VGE09_06465 [Pseudoxanthomonas sp.]
MSDSIEAALLAAGIRQPMRVRVTNEEACAAVYRMLGDGWRLVPSNDRNTVYDLINESGDISPHRVYLKANGAWHFEMQVTL